MYTRRLAIHTYVFLLVFRRRRLGRRSPRLPGPHTWFVPLTQDGDWRCSHHRVPTRQHEPPRTRSGGMSCMAAAEPKPRGYRTAINPSMVGRGVEVASVATLFASRTLRGNTHTLDSTKHQQAPPTKRTTPTKTQPQTQTRTPTQHKTKVCGWLQAAPMRDRQQYSSDLGFLLETSLRMYVRSACPSQVVIARQRKLDQQHPSLVLGGGSAGVCRSHMERLLLASNCG